MIDTNLIEDLRVLTPPDYGWLVLVALACVALLILGLCFRRRQARALGRAAAGSAPGPWDVALAELERLTPLLQPERSRDYGIESTAILRRYVEARYDLHAPLLTTEEFLVTAGQSPVLPAEHRAHLGHFLGLCDLFKFGRYVASSEELHELHTAAVTFVIRSRPEPLPPAREESR